MKFLIAIAALITFCGGVSGGNNPPQFTVGINGGQHGTIAGLEPALKWMTSATAGEFDLDGGVTVLVRDTGSELKPAYSLWGRIKRTVRGFDLSARADLADAQLNNMALDFRAEGEPGSIQILGKTGSTNAVTKIQLKKSFEVKGGVLRLNPRFDIQKSKGDVSVGYSLNDIDYIVDASPENQKLTLARFFGEKKETKVAPTVSLQGDLSLQIQQKLSDSGKLTATLTPKESIDIKWEEGPWIANINAPMEGYLMEGGVDVSVRRKVDVF